MEKGNLKAGDRIRTKSGAVVEVIEVRELTEALVPGVYVAYRSVNKKTGLPWQAIKYAPINSVTREEAK